MFALPAVLRNAVPIRIDHHQRPGTQHREHRAVRQSDITISMPTRILVQKERGRNFSPHGHNAIHQLSRFQAETGIYPYWYEDFIFESVNLLPTQAASLSSMNRVR